MWSISARVPYFAGPSSSPVMTKLIVPDACGISATAATIAAIAPFISTAPRPCSSAPRRSGRKGPEVQPSPGGTTSTWPAKAKWRLPLGPLRMAKRFSTGPSGGSPVTARCTAKPSGARLASRQSNTRPAAGVTLGQAISASVSSTGSIARLISASPALRTARSPSPRPRQRRPSPAASRVPTPLPYRPRQIRERRRHK